MGKKNREEPEAPVRRGKKGDIPFSVLGTTFEKVQNGTARQHILYLIIAAIVAKFLVAFVTETIFNSFVDLFDIGYYLQQGNHLVQGQIPYVNFDFAYPVLLLVPVVIALVPAILFSNGIWFVFTFQTLMVLCDIVTVICVYLISLKLRDERTAFYCGLFFAAMLPAAYFVITKYDAFPTAFLMLAIVCTIYGQTVKGYAASVIGFFIKVFPGLALPFLVIYNAKRADVKQEILSALKVALPVGALLFIPLFLLKPDTIKIYIPIRSELGYYSNTATFTLHSWLHGVLNLGISIDAVSAVMYGIMILGILALIVLYWKLPQKDVPLLLKFILCAIILVVVCSKVRSPQYIVWYTPLLCILAIDDIKKMTAVIVYQVLAYIEFPLMFGAYYTALEYTNPVGSAGWMTTLVLFTLMYIALLACVWLVVEPRDIAARLKQP